MTARPVTAERSRRGRPPKVIEPDELIAAVKRLFAEGGIAAVSIERTAQELSVSRARLYRTVPSKEDLLGLLYDDMIEELERDSRRASADDGRSPRERFEALVAVQVDATLRMRDYLFVFFDRTRLPAATWESWRRWQANYEARWRDVVSAMIAASDIPVQDPVVATRLILGMTIWVAQWYREGEGISAEAIRDEVLGLLLTERRGGR